MLNFFRYSLILLLALTFCQPSATSVPWENPPRGKAYFVSPDGSPVTNQIIGSIDYPMNSIQEAINQAQPGDTIWIRGGIYSEIIYIERSGNANRPIVISNYKDEKVILDGKFLNIPRYLGVMNIYNQDYLVIKGIQIQNSPEVGIVVRSSSGSHGHIVLQNISVKNTGREGFSIEYINHIQLINCRAESAQNGFPGFYLFRDENVLLKNCTASYNGSGGGGLAQGFVFYEGGYYQVIESKAFGNERDGFDVGGGETGAHDLIFTDCQSFENGEDGFGINSYVSNITINRALIYDNGNNGFNIYEGTSNVTINNSTIVGGLHYFWIDGSDNPNRPVEHVHVRNSIGYGARDRAIITVAPFRQLDFDYNNWSGIGGEYGAFCLWNMGWDELTFDYEDIGVEGDWYRVLGQGEHSFSKNPSFVSVENRNFELSSASPCIDAGVSVGLPYYGNAPDMGAFEFRP